MAEGDTTKDGASGAGHLVRRYLCLAILLATAAYQAYRVQVDGLSPWKGGGFGMYTTVHFDDFQVWAWWSRPGRPTRFAQITGPQSLEARALLSRAKVFPTSETLAELRDHLPFASGAIQVWRPYLDPETLEYKRELVAEGD
jgi:hypothetical protein